MTVIDARPFIAIGIAFLAALLVSMSNKYPNIRETWSAVGSITMFGVIISMVGGVLDGVTYEYTLFHLTDTVGLTMRVDPAGMIFAALASMLWIPINFYSIGYMRNNHEGMQTGYFAAFALCIGATMGIAMASNLLTFFVFYEILTISSYPLVLHERDEEALLASRKYLAYTLVSGQLFLAGTVGVYCIAGTMDFTPGGFLRIDMAPAWVLQLLFVLMIMAGSVVGSRPRWWRRRRSVRFSMRWLSSRPARLRCFAYSASCSGRSSSQSLESRIALLGRRRSRFSQARLSRFVRTT